MTTKNQKPNKISSGLTLHINIRLKAMKAVENNMKKVLWNWQIFFFTRSQNRKQKQKADKWNLKLKGFCKAKRNLQGEKTTYRMGRSIC